MVTDFTEMFRNPDELADLYLLSVDEQDRILADFAARGKAVGIEMSCTIAKNVQPRAAEA